MGWLVDKVHLLHETTQLRLGEVAIFFNAQKPIQTVKENEDTKEYVPNRRIR